jgi:hypothetical protein
MTALSHNSVPKVEFGVDPPRRPHDHVDRSERSWAMLAPNRRLRQSCRVSDAERTCELLRRWHVNCDREARAALSRSFCRSRNVSRGATGARTDRLRTLSRWRASVCWRLSTASTPPAESASCASPFPRSWVNSSATSVRPAGRRTFRGAPRSSRSRSSGPRATCPRRLDKRPRSCRSLNIWGSRSSRPSSVSKRQLRATRTRLTIAAATFPGADTEWAVGISSSEQALILSHP